MAAGYVGSLGGAVGSDFSAFLTFVTTRDIAANEHVVVAACVPVGITSITVGSLSLSADFSDSSIKVFSGRATAPIATGATVLITLSSEQSAGNKRAVADVLTNVASSAWVRSSGSNTLGFGTDIDVGTTDGTPLAGDLAYSIGHSLGLVAFTAAVNGVTFANTGLNSPKSGYEVLAGAGAVGGVDFTIASADDYRGAIVVYKATAAVALDNCLPDADVVATGWSTAPLFSKVNDGSDATVIQATAV